MPTKITARGNSLAGNQYRVFIDAGGPGGTESIEVPLVDLNYSYEANVKNADYQISASTCNVTLLLMSQNDRVALNEALNGNEENNFIRVLRNGSVDWIGGIMLELLTERDEPYPQEQTIRATDGLARLKDTPYDFEGHGDDEYVVITEHFRRILALCPGRQQYNTGQLFVRYNVTAWPEQLTPSNGVNPLDKLRLSTKAFRTVDDKGEITFSKAYDVLVELLKGFGLRIIYAKGFFSIFSIANASRFEETLIWHEYDVTMNKIGVDTQPDWSNEFSRISVALLTPTHIKMLAGGVITKQPPVRRVEYTYKHYSKQNLSPQTVFTSESQFADASIENFLAGGGTTLRVSGRIRASITPPPGTEFPAANVFAIISLRLYVREQDGTNHGLIRTYNYAGGLINYNEPYWEDEGLQYDCPIAAPGNPYYVTETLFSIETPVVPAGGELNIGFNLSEIIVNGEPFLGAEATYEIDNVFLESLIDGSNEDQYNYSTYALDNPNFQFNSRVDEREVLIGDGPSDNTFGRLEAETAEDVWEKTLSWRHYVGGDYLPGPPKFHTRLLAEDLLLLRRDTREEIDTAFIAPNYFISDVLRRSNQILLLQRATFNVLRDEVSGRWLEIGYTDPGTLPGGNTTEFIFAPIGTNNPIDVPVPVVADTYQSSPPLGGPQLAFNTVIAELENDIDSDVEYTVLSISATPEELPLQAGDQIIITHPYTGQTEVVTIEVDYLDGVLNPWTTNGGLDWITNDDQSWIVDSNPGLQVVGFTTENDFPEGSYIQLYNVYDVNVTQLSKVVHEDFNLFGTTTPIQLGVQSLFWRPVQRVGWRIEGISFALFANAGATTSVIRVTYTSVAGDSSTVAEYDSSDLTFYAPLQVNVLEGAYTFEVVSMDGSAPTGLQIIFQLRKQFTE